MSTLLPIKTTSPLRAKTVPAIETAPPDPLLPPKRRRPAKASASLICRLDAVKPAVSTTAPAPTVIPAWLTKTRFPLLPKVPNNCDGVLVTTRLIDVLEALGCWKNVVLPCGTEKLCQLMAEWLVPAPFWVVTSKLVPEVAIVACPTTATPPAGFAIATKGTVPHARAIPAASALSPKFPLKVLTEAEADAPVDRPPEVAISATATMAPKDWFQTVR